MSRLVKCENGHFYDADKYAKCPNCSRGAGPKKDVVMTRGLILVVGLLWHRLIPLQKRLFARIRARP